MLQYEKADSPFFEANKKYCGQIELELKTANAECFGFCNSFGYQISANLNRNNLSFTLALTKGQWTQNGVIIPIHARDQIDGIITVTGLNKNAKVSAGNSPFRRFFTSIKNQKQIPKPYYIKSNYLPGDQTIDVLVKFILSNKISKLRLKDRTLVCKVPYKITDPLDLIADIEKTILNL
jgi:hypothetical protein